MKNATSIILLAGILAPFGAIGQVTIANDFTAGTYSQNFDSLGWNASESQFTFTNNSTLTGWSLSATTYRAAWNGTEASNNLGSTEVKSLQILTSGTQAGGDRVWDGDTRLGARTGSGLGDFFATLQIDNDSGSAVTGFSLDYQAAQFYARESGAIWAEYSLDNTNWTVIDGSGGSAGDADLRYAAPVSSPGTSRAVTETELLNSITDLSSSVSGITVNDGSSLWVRFAFYRDIPGGSTGNSPILAIDDVSITAVPEPATYALLSGFAAFGLMLLHRRLRR